MEIGTIVFLITDPEQHARMITRIQHSPCGTTYCLSFGITESWHYGIEFASEQNEFMRLGITAKQEKS